MTDKQVLITLRLKYDPRKVSHPGLWDWGDLIGPEFEDVSGWSIEEDVVE